MERLIGANALIRCLDEKVGDGWHSCSLAINMGYIDGMADAIHAVDDQPTVEVPRWIPVSERLPDFGVDVLVCNDEGVQVTAKRTGWSTDPNRWAINYCGYDYDSWDFTENGDIVAWMELQEPYERKEE